MKIGGEKMRTASGQKGENEHRPIDFFFLLFLLPSPSPFSITRFYFFV